MTTSKKEQILQKIEDIIKSIVAGTSPDTIPAHVYSNTVAYVDRQYQDVSMEDIESKPKPWVILNNEGEQFGALPSRNFENKIYVQIIGIVEANESNKNLDSLMNSLQKDIMLAILNDVSLSGLASYVLPIDIQVVNEMIWPFGAFSFNLEVIYCFQGLNF